MQYQRPSLIDLSQNSSLGFGGAPCSVGSGAVGNCTENGNLAESYCITQGISGLPQPPKYED